MIARLWHGWTKRENADAYTQLLREKILPGIELVQGYEGAHVLRRDTGEEVEFITITFFQTMDAVRAFAGDDYELAVVSEQAKKLLAHYDARSVHYEVALGGP